MNYWKGLFFNIFAVYFLNSILPGLEIVNATRLPHVGGDLMFAIVIGLFNSLIYPVMRLVNAKITKARIALIAIVISFVAYAISRFAPVGVEVKSIEGYLIAAVLVAVIGFLTNFLEMKRHMPKMPMPPVE